LTTLITLEYFISDQLVLLISFPESQSQLLFLLLLLFFLFKFKSDMDNYSYIESVFLFDKKILKSPCGENQAFICLCGVLKKL